MDVHYGLLLKKSWKDLKNNLIVFLPILYSILFGLGLIIIVGLEVLLFLLLGINKSNLIIYLVLIAIFTLIDFILLLLIGAVIRSMNIGLLNAVVIKKKATTNDMWAGAKKYVFRYFKITVIKILLILLPLIVLGLLGLLGFLANKTFGIVLFVIFAIIYILYLIAIVLLFIFGLFFLEPILSVSKNNSAIAVMKESFKYTKENFSHVLLTWVITFAIGLVITIPQQLIGLPMQIFPISVIIFLPMILVLWIVSIIIGMWLSLFVFNSYFNRNLKKL